MNDFLSAIAEYIIPVYSKLYSGTFYYYFQSNQPDQLSLDRLVNNGYRAIAATDDDLFDIYCYMLQYGLFDVRSADTDRYEGSFEAYLDSYNAPFIFISTKGNINDYGDLFHEFGHFADDYINNGVGASLDLTEVSSQGLELLMLHYMDNAADQSVCAYLNNKKLCEALETLIFQGFYAKFEHLAYSIPYSDINEDNLCDAVVDAAEMFGFNTELANNLSAVSIPHVFLYPFYVQSYCTSVVPALELYFTEENNEGLGIACYKKLINRTDSTLGFTQSLEAAGLSSPFAKDFLKKIANSIHYAITGADYYGLINKTNSVT
jgi:oligoendopeptidase F